MLLSKLKINRTPNSLSSGSVIACALVLVAMNQPVQAASFGDLIPSALQTKPAEATQVLSKINSGATEVAANAELANTDLVGSLMSQLKLNQTQAQGGLGSLLTLAKGNLGEQEFASLSQQIPNTDTLLAAAPSLTQSSGMSGLLSKVGGDLGSSLQGGAMVYDSFEKLGIPKDMLVPMVDIAKSYLDAQGGEGATQLLVKGLGALQL